MSLLQAGDEKYLHIISDYQEFPEEALEEIRQERMVEQKELLLPPCRVEMVLGLEGRLFVILPTGVSTSLPFASNAPFIQDPARLKIKDPETSPTNRWLLDRVGNLAANSSLAWLKNNKVDRKQRANAYDLVPGNRREYDSLDASVSKIVCDAFDRELTAKPFIMTDGGELVEQENCVVTPPEIISIWSSEQASVFFDEDKRPLLNRHISDENRGKLIHLEWVDEINKSRIMEVLENRRLPRPDSWMKLLTLWNYIAPLITGYRINSTAKNVNIIPVQGKEVLCAGSEVVRLGEKKLLQSQNDWDFLSRYLLVMNPNWTVTLAEYRRRAREGTDGDFTQMVENAYSVLQVLGLDETSDAAKVIERVSRDFFSSEKIRKSDCIRLAQICAKLDVPVGEDFSFSKQNGRLSGKGEKVIVDVDGDLDLYADAEWIRNHGLHGDYMKHYESCTREEWRRWIRGGSSSCITFIPIVHVRSRIFGHDRIRALLSERGYTEEPRFPFKTDSFFLEDWDFAPEHWETWNKQVKKQQNYIGRLFDRFLKQPVPVIEKSLKARVLHEAYTGSTKEVTQSPLIPV
ncbi:MAG TPA: hypothetical protein VLH40_06315, partial [Atribacteraceae bacterium]|nr:hypothetical protein [Atribacteraceae bacterium]